MIAIVCVDDKGGMTFFGKRQSKDRAVFQRIAEIIEDAPLWINSFSASLFEGAPVTVDDAFLDKAGDGEFCFVENEALTPYTEKIEKLIVYQWNRAYPSDRKLDVDRSCWKLASVCDFAGYSHDKITEEIYIK